MVLMTDKPDDIKRSCSNDEQLMRLKMELIKVCGLLSRTLMIVESLSTSVDSISKENIDE